jgi:hypothetical protein
MTNLIVSIIILAIVAGAITKIVIEKKKGVKCIGCPYSESDNENCSCSISK